MTDITLLVSMPTDRSYSPTQEVSMDILPDNLEELVKQRLPYSTISYLALVTEFDFEAWFNSPAKFKDKWRLAMLIMKGEADDEMILNIMQGEILYPVEEEHKRGS